MQLRLSFSMQVDFAVTPSLDQRIPVNIGPPHCKGNFAKVFRFNMHDRIDNSKCCTKNSCNYIIPFIFTKVSLILQFHNLRKSSLIKRCYRHKLTPKILITTVRQPMNPPPRKNSFLIRFLNI